MTTKPYDKICSRSVASHVFSKSTLIATTVSRNDAKCPTR